MLVVVEFPEERQANVQHYALLGKLFHSRSSLFLEGIKKFGNGSILATSTIFLRTSTNQITPQIRAPLVIL